MTERVLPAQLVEGSEGTPSVCSRPTMCPSPTVCSCPPGEDDGPLPPIGPAIDGDLVAVSDAGVEQDPHVELDQLRRAMRTRPAIDMARGVLMASFGLSAEDAWSVLVSVSQHTNTKLHLVADELVSAATGGEIPKPFRRQLAATIAQLRAAPTAPTEPTAANAGEE
ncbi:ANTAR domain-containing protein [Streptomyces sp. NPDC054871]